MYKDKDRQREAVRLAVRRHRAKGITKVLHNEGITVSQDEVVIPKCSRAMPDGSTDIGVVKVLHEGIKPQSHNSMMVGYVPPREARK